jgi:hypothetical protein
MSNAERWSGYGRVFFGLCFVVGFLAVVDWAADGGSLDCAIGIWDSIPYLWRVVIFCLAVGVATSFGIFYAMVRSAVAVDENECPIQVKGEK